MKKILSVMVLLLATAILPACQGGDRDDLKSPCVGTSGSPCDHLKRNVNDWWLA
jgi:hypothetical protein